MDTKTRRVGAVLAAVGAAVAIGAGPAAAAVAPMTVTVNPAGTANPDGSATVSGTVTCPLGNTFYGYADVWQPVRTAQTAYGRGLFGDVRRQIACTGVPQPWQVTTTSRTAPFLPGPDDVRAVFATQGPAGLNTVARDQLGVLV
jgi:hypothetical protein